MRKERRMKSVIALSVLLISPMGQAAEEVIKDKSPDGKFALRVTKDDMGGSAAIVDLKSKGEVATMETYQNYTEEAHLVWSKDSQRVAYFEPDRRGGSTTAYFWDGSEFKEVSIPYGDPIGDFPACEDKSFEKNSDDPYVKDIEFTARPVKWLPSGELVLAVHCTRITESGATGSSARAITIAFDANRKASVESVKDKKSEHE
jgi:hypothetical protein